MQRMTCHKRRKGGYCMMILAFFGFQGYYMRLGCTFPRQISFFFPKIVIAYVRLLALLPLGHSILSLNRLLWDGIW